MRSEISDGQQRLMVLERWRECDDNDDRQPDSPVVVLCPSCSGKLIEKHPRLYHALQKYEPWPGASLICVTCVHRVDTHCTQSRAYGGQGLLMHAERIRALVRRSRGRGHAQCEAVMVYAGEPTSCTHRKER